MIKALPPSSYSRTAEILSRYRPIAPKPDPLPSNCGTDKTQQSPYPSTLLPQLHARSARSRKRGRASSMATTTAAALSSTKRHRSAAPPGHASPVAVPSPHGHVFCLNHEGPGPGVSARSLVTLPLLPGLETGSSQPYGLDYHQEGLVTAVTAEVLEEKDLLQQLQDKQQQQICPGDLSLSC